MLSIFKIKKLEVSLAVACWLIAGQIFSQNVEISEPPAVVQLMENWQNQNRIKPEVNGWRVQILSTTDRKQVEDGKLRFKTQFPDVPVDWVHDKPYYKLRAGAFRTKQEAMALVNALQDVWSGAYPAKDSKIHPRDFLSQ